MIYYKYGSLSRKKTEREANLDIKMVLIVDDTPGIRDLVEMIIKLSSPDAVIFHAEHGARAWEIIKSQNSKIDLVVSDVDMPIMGGVELVGKIRQDYPEVHIILMSGNLEPKGHKAGVFVPKPFHVDDLASTIKRLMEKPQE
jgi:two-component system chemotaxis response regulator CheY